MTELCHSRLNRDVKWEGVPVDYGAGKECVLVIVFECWVFSHSKMLRNNPPTSSIPFCNFEYYDVSIKMTLTPRKQIYDNALFRVCNQHAKNTSDITSIQSEITK